MKRSVSAAILGLLGLAAVGCKGPGGESRLRSIDFNQNNYVVQVGDTAESIAWRYGLSTSELSRLNRGRLSTVAPGDRIRIRSGQRSNGSQNTVRRYAEHGGNSERRTEVAANYRPDRTTRNDTDSAQESQLLQPRGRLLDEVTDQVVIAAVPARDQPLRTDGRRVVTEEIIEESVATELLIPRGTASMNGTERDGWRWPSDGEVVRDYAPNEVNGQGIDIAGVPGQKINASASGMVIYAGRDLSNSGNLVIIRHADGLLSTYSHARDLYVAEDDMVKGGDPIASLGWNNDKESVLHFGIRNNGKPVDPGRYLPAR